MGADSGLLSALRACFWTYASLILSEDEKRALAANLRQAGGRVQGRIPAPEGRGPDSLSRLLDVAYGAQGAAFVHHAGYYSGGEVARKFVTTAPHPTDAMVRLVDAFIALFEGLHFVADAPENDRLDFTVGSKVPLPRSFTEFASGLVKGAAKRVNEGAAPGISERVEHADSNWVVTILWSAGPDDPGAARLKGGSKTRRK